MGAKFDRDSERWNRLRDEAERLDDDVLKSRIRHYEGMSEGMRGYFGIFRIARHTFESFFGRAVTLDQYEVAQQVLSTRNLLRESKRMFE